MHNFVYYLILSMLLIPCGILGLVLGLFGFPFAFAAGFIAGVMLMTALDRWIAEEKL